MDFNTPSKTPMHGAGISKPKNPQQLVGGCKKSLGSPVISSPAARRTPSSTLAEFKKRIKNASPMGPSSLNNINNENCRPSLKRPTNVHPRALAMVQASINQNKNNSMNGIWHMGHSNNDNNNNNTKSEQSPRPTIFSEDPIIVSNNFNTSTLRTYSKMNTPRKVESSKSTGSTPSNSYTANNNAGTSSRVNALACLPLNSSVTVTAVPSNSQSSSSLRKPKFEESSSTSRVSFEDDNDEENDLLNFNSAKKLKRQPLTPIRPALKSSILSDISPTKIDKAYGLGSSPTSEKENVPFAEVEKVALPHLLGFPNLGNTCYLNAVLQSLVGVRVFRCDVSSCVQGLGSSVPPSTLLSALTQLLAARKTGLTHNLRQPLRYMKENFEKLDSNFIGWKMQDANEFLTKVLDTMKDEVDKLTSKVKCEGSDFSAVGCLALDNDVSSSTHQDTGCSPLNWSPFKPNVPKILNNSVEIRSLPPQNWSGETVTGGSKRMKRSCSPDCSNGGIDDATSSHNGEQENTPFRENKKSQQLNNSGKSLSNVNNFNSPVNNDKHSSRNAHINNENHPIFNGNLSPITNGNHSPISNANLSPIPNGNHLGMVNGNYTHLTNGRQSPIMNGRRSPIINGQQSPIASGSHSLLHSEGVQSTDADSCSTSSVALTNGSSPSLSSSASPLVAGMSGAAAAERRPGSARSRRPSASPSRARKRLRAVDIARKRKLSSALQASEQNILVNPITDNFGFQLHEILKCLGCGEVLKRSQDYFSLYVHLSPSSCNDEDEENPVGPSSIKDAVDNYMKQEEREVKCDRCSHPMAMVTTRFTKMPRILIIQVKRYTYSAAQYSSLKVSSSIGVNKRLDLSPYTERETSQYPAVTGEPVRSAPPTPCKMPAPATPTKTTLQKLRLNGVATLSSCDSDEAKATSTAEGDSSITDDKTSSLTEDEQLQEALRRSLEDNVATGSSSDVPQTIVLGDEEEDDLQRAIRLSLLDAQQQQEAENRLSNGVPEVDANERQIKEEEEEEEEEEECIGPHSYTLASIVSHLGRNTTAGHYTSDVLSEAGRAWLHYDDESVTEVSQSTVLGDSRQRNGYIFFYVHRDLLSPDC